MAFCRNCGSEIDESLSKCPKCGVKVIAEFNEEEIATVLNHKKIIKKRLLITCISLLLVIILAVAGVCIYLKSEVSKSEFENYYCGDYNVYRININRLFNNIEETYSYWPDEQRQSHWKNKGVEDRRERIIESICDYKPANAEIKSVHKYLVESCEYLDEIVDLKRKELLRGISKAEENELDKNIEYLSDSLNKYYRACEKYCSKYNIEKCKKINLEMR